MINNNDLLTRESFDDAIIRDVNAIDYSINNINNYQKHGVCMYIAGSWNDIDTIIESINYLKNNGLKSIQIVIQLNLNYTDYTVSKFVTDENLEKVFEACSGIDYKMLKVHQNTSFSNKFSENIKILPAYKTALESYIPLLNKYNVNTLCLTNENPNATVLELKSYWLEIINSLKNKGYLGEISMSYTMAQASNDVIADIFDVLCVNTYPSLSSNEDNPSFTTKVGNWNSYLNKLKEFKDKNNNKKLYITEVGCQPYNGRLGMPGINQYNTGLNEQVQYDFYEATLPTLSRQEFIDGWFIWECNKPDFSYSPIGRKAEKILLEYL